MDNTERFLNEAFANSTGTQRSDMGMYKKFTLNLVNVALPDLIAPELVITYPMSSMSGYITYLNYTAGSNKGATAQGDVFNNPFKLGAVDVNYTAARVVESFTGANSDVEAAWYPVYNGDVLVTKTKGHTVIVTSGSPRTIQINHYPKYTGVSNSLVTALQNVGERDTTLAHRKEIAQANGISNYTGLAIQNTTMLKLLKQGTLIKP